MSDIVERLRDQGRDAFAKHYSLGMYKLCAEAADEIERLRFEGSDADAQLDAFGKVSPQQYEKDAASLRARIRDLERVFADACDKAGCAHDNEALLQSISDLNAKSSPTPPSPIGGEQP